MYVKSVFVDDQQKALDFYTQKLGFVKKLDMPMGEHRWLTLTSPEESESVELLLEPNAHPASKTFQAAMKADGIPFTAFSTNDIAAEFERLKQKGVHFVQEPAAMGDAQIATFDDSCGNLIQLVQTL